MFKEIIKLLQSIDNHLAAIRTGNKKEVRIAGNLILDEKAIKELAEALYPKIKQMAAWGH